MKKYIFIAILCLIFPLKTLAYGINNYLVNATIEENGDLLVSEYFELTGSFNGFERIINYKNSNSIPFNPDLEMFDGSTINDGDNIELLEIRGVEKNNFDFENVTGDLFTEKNYANAGDYGYYTINDNIIGYRYKIFLPSNKNKAFYLKYKIKNIAVLHNDVGELFWNILGDELTESIASLTAYINIPNNIDIRAWAHGPLNGDVEIVNSQKVKVIIDGLSANTPIDVRVTFDRDVIQNSTKLTNVNALNKILNYEQIKADEANEQRKELEQRKIAKAFEQLNYFQNNLTKENYELALNSINQISDEEIKNNLLEILEGYKKKLDELLYKKANNLIDIADNTLSYDDYLEALNAIEEVEIEQDKIELNKKITKVYEKIKNKEIEHNKEYIFYMAFLLVTYLIIVFTTKVLRELNIRRYFNYEYLREIDSEMDLETIEYIMDNKITSKTISAITLNLINKKIISYEKTEDNNIIMTYHEENANVNEIESALIKYLFVKGKVVNLKEFQNVTRYNYKFYIDLYEKLENTILDKINNQQIFTNTYLMSECTTPNISLKLVVLSCISILFKSPIILALYEIILLIKLLVKLFRGIDLKIFLNTIMSMGIIYLGIYFSLNIIKNDKIIYYAFYFIIAISIYIFVAALKNLKKQAYRKAGKIKLAKIKALKRFLNDFGRLNEKTIPDVTLWNKYLIYAIALGCSDKLAKEMNSKLEIENINYDLLDMYSNMYDVYNSTLNYTIRNTRTIYYNKIREESFESFMSDFASAASSSDSSSSGRFSSGSGSGGGFSSGGGHGGGGGGGSRF